MLTGRPRKPTALKVLEGNPGKRALPKAEPKLRVSLPSPPRHLDALARAKWTSIGKQLLEMRVVTDADAGALEALCMAYSTWRRAEKVLAKEGLTYASVSDVGATVIKKRPEVEIAADAWRRFVAGLDRFGLSPALRGKVSAIGSEDSADGDAAKQAAFLA